MFKPCSTLLALLLTQAAVWMPTARAAQGPLVPEHLRCEYLKNPLGIDVRQPRFAWVDRHTERAQSQSAYEILVASSAELLAQDRGDVWDSGKTTSDDSTQVVYGGKPLASDHSYWWKVRYWDKDGNPSRYSDPASFGVALLVRDEWKGQWIGGANMLRKEISIPGKVVRARAYVTALGYYELRINGEKVGQNELDPGWTTYQTRVLYSTYDVTSQLHSGKNAFGAMIGGGWAVLGAGDVPAPYKQPALLVQVNIQLADGKTVEVASDGTWKKTDGPIVSDGVWDGEVYDARREQPGWDSPGFDDSAWSAAETLEGSKGILSAQMMPAIRDVDTIVPVALNSPEPGGYVYDMGQNFSGWVDLHVTGPRGAKVQLRFAELVYDTGMINRENIREAKSRDIYILKGEGKEVYHPHFTYHGFRYVEVTGYPGVPSIDSLRGHVIHTAVDTTGSFVTSNRLLNQIHNVIHWSDVTNLMSVPTDCDQRNERMGWLGDSQTSAEGMLLNFDMAAVYTNFVREIHDVEDANGTVTDTVPHRYGSRPADPAWGTAYPLITWYVYQQTGDRRILEENYGGLKKYVEFLRTRAPDNLLRFSSYGDWVSVEKTPGALVSDFYYYYDTLLVAKIAAILGNSSDATAYNQLAGQIKDAFNREFFDAKTGNYANGTQTANALALFLDMPPRDRRGAVAGNLVNSILYQHDTHLTTGFIGARYLMPVLTEIGQSALAYDLADQTTFPSWGYMVTHGATTLWELWQDKTGPEMNSHDHHMMGSVDAWFYEALGGINVDPDHPGYRQIRIEPQVARDLTSVDATVGTIRGQVTSSWTHQPGTVTLHVDVPVNSTATVSIPKDLEMTDITVREGDRTIWEQGHFVEGTPGVTAGSFKDGRVIFEVGSGHYEFKLTGE